MIEEHAVIVAVDHHQTPVSVAYLEVERRAACGLCGQTRGCGNRIWGTFVGHHTTFSAKNSIDALIGQRVVVVIDEKSVMYAALLLYLVPLVTMLIMAVIFAWIFASMGAQLLGAILGLILSWMWIKAFLSVRPHGLATPEIVRLADDQNVVICKN